MKNPVQNSSTLPSRAAKALIGSLALALVVSAAPAQAQYITQQGAARLNFLLNTHVYAGQRVTQDVRNATGDPNIIVVDRRHTFGETYRCSYAYRGNPRYRYLVCD